MKLRQMKEWIDLMVEAEGEDVLDRVTLYGDYDDMVDPLDPRLFRVYDDPNHIVVFGGYQWHGPEPTSGDDPGAVPTAWRVAAPESEEDEVPPDGADTLDLSIPGSITLVDAARSYQVRITGSGEPWRTMAARS